MPAPAERSSGRWGDLGVRALSAAVLTPIAVACVWLGGIAFIVIVAVVVAGLAIEWLLLFRRLREGADGSSASPSHPGLFSAGLLYVAIAAASLLWLRADPISGRADVLFLLLIVWAGDIGAYLVGRWIGGPRLAPQISPGKTWSGAVGGLLVAVAAGLLAAHFLAAPVAPWQPALIAVVLGIVAQAGDLLESIVKRVLAVKDSGNLIPGHGGLFDRLDGVLAAAPVAALLALALGRGVVLWQ
ncbi:MAG TPA: phosphatidate cytidylyltransferase [Acetobacteraceae bacterium]|nr:phosphatidate cytidylyltransferase [Acetobacteraceae bacterium]